MKPAPPVTSSLATGKFLQHAPQVGSPMPSLPQSSPAGGLVQDAVRQPLGWARKLITANWTNGECSLHCSELERLFLDRYCEFVPASDLRVGPISTPVNRGIRRR